MRRATRHERVGFSAIARELPALLAFRLRSDLRTGTRQLTPALVAAVALVLVLPGMSLLLVPRLPTAPAAGGAGGVAGGAPDWVAVGMTVLPPAWAFFVVSAVLSVTGSAGGRSLLPRTQAVAFPVAPATDHTGALLMSPLNLAWSVQVVGLLAATGFVADLGTSALFRLLALSVLWVVAATVAAQSVGWAVQLLQTLPGGRVVTWLTAVGSIAVVALTVARVGATEILDRLPTRAVVDAALSGGPVYGVAVAVLICVATVTFVAGAHLAAALSRRPGHAGSQDETRPRAPSPWRGTAFAHAVSLERRLVLRTPPLRRGLLILVGMPMVGVLLVPLPWEGLTVLPALVAAAGGLLWGVNAFAVDGPGALWRLSLPADPLDWLDARLLVLAQTLLTGAALVTAAGTLRAVASGAAPPTAGQAAAMLCTLLAVVTQVCVRCMRWSVTRPQAAPLRDVRDAPAPPATLAGYSVRLTAVATVTGLALGAAGALGGPLPPVGIALAIVLLEIRAGIRVRRSFTRPESPSRVAATVAGG